MPITKSKQGKPLGGIGAERQSRRTHSLVIDDRLLSKQYITGRLDARIDDTAYGVGWDGVTDKAPSVNAVYDKINSLGTISDIWGQEDAAQSNTDVRFKRTGNFGVGNGTSLDFNDITEKLYVDGNIKATGNLLLGSGASATDYTITFDGESNDGALTWMEDEDYFKFSDDILMNSTERLNFGDTGTYIYQSIDGQLDLVADTEIQIAATTIDMNGAADISGNLDVSGNLTVTGNLVVTGSATSTLSEIVEITDAFMLLNSDATGTPLDVTDVGIEVERGDSLNRKLFWDEGDDEWKIQTGDSTYVAITSGASDHAGITLGTNTATALSLSGQELSLADKFVQYTGGAMTGNLDVQVSGATDNCLTIIGGDSAADYAAVSINGHLEATTKSFNIPHPLLDNKRLIHGSLEGPEHGMYTRGSFEIEDKRRIVAVDLPNYWPVMVYDDYTINLTAYGNYNVWISNRDENGFWVETNAEKEWSFDWNVIAGRKDAKLVVELDA